MKEFLKKVGGFILKGLVFNLVLFVLFLGALKISNTYLDVRFVGNDIFKVFVGVPWAQEGEPDDEYTFYLRYDDDPEPGYSRWYFVKHHVNECAYAAEKRGETPDW